MLLLSLAAAAAGLASLPAFASPTGVVFTDDAIVNVVLCLTVNLTMPPTAVPFHTELVKLSGCEKGEHQRTVALPELVDMLTAETPERAWHEPAGLRPCSRLKMSWKPDCSTTSASRPSLLPDPSSSVASGFSRVARCQPEQPGVTWSRLSLKLCSA